MCVTSSDAHNRFGSLCAQALHEPVFVATAGQLGSVMLSVEQQQALLDGQEWARRSAAMQVFEA
mgnify:CR=1 FL=1